MRLFRPLFLVMSSVLVVFALSACQEFFEELERLGKGRDDAPAPTSTFLPTLGPGPTSTAIPTRTPVPTLTPTASPIVPPTLEPTEEVGLEPTAAPAEIGSFAIKEDDAPLPLTESAVFFEADYALSLEHPQGWIVEGEFGFYTLASSQAALEFLELDEEEVPDQVASGFFAGSLIVITEPLEAGTSVDAETVFELLRESAVASDDGGFTIQRDVPIQIAGYDGVVAPLIADFADLDGVIYSLNYGEGVVLAALLLASPGELDLYESTYAALLESIQIERLEPDAEATEEAGP
ncbi:MAG: hypothetical protein HC915_18810 [Anaerolineae bacterium]|nr:hypothetical protein [Anaerolineae bacterium]